jgi:integrase
LHYFLRIFHLRQIFNNKFGSLERRPGRPHWYATYQLNGHETSRSTGTDDRAEARAVLADLVRDVTKAQESPYLFPRAHCASFERKPGQPLLTRTIFQVIRHKVSPIVGRPVHPHMLRHSFASRLRENGAPLELIQEALGHANISTTLIYAHLSTKKRREDLAKYLEGRG